MNKKFTGKKFTGKKFTGIKRKWDYSPNHIENDAQILLKTAQELKKLGADVSIYDEAEIINNGINSDFIFSMAQGPDAQEKLFELEKKGTTIINSPKGVTNCYRVNMVKKLQESEVPFPKSYIYNTSLKCDKKLSDFNLKKLWIKRGDVHAVHREDVTFVYSDDEKENVLNEFNKRGIKQAVLQHHVEGDLIKFYAVRDSDFFHWFQINGKEPVKFDIEKLKKYALRSAEVLDLYIYGGDAIISKDNSITIIDINDWPSFAPIREEASKNIAKLIFKKAGN